MSLFKYPLEILAGFGQINASAIVLEGHNTAGITTSQIIQAAGGATILPATVGVTKISSSSASDTAAGTGARTVLVTGLDTNWNIISETVTLSGQTGVTLANQYLRVNFMNVLTAGSGGVNAGTIYVGTGSITAGVPATKIRAMAVGDNQTQCAVYSVPAGYSLYISNVVLNGYDVSATLGTEVLITYTMAVTLLGSLAQTQFSIPTCSGSVNKNYAPYLKIPAKSDIVVSAVGTVAAQVACQMSGYLIQN